MIFEHLDKYGHEELLFYADPSCNLKAIVAIHDTTLGPALGGTRFWTYEKEEDAITDALRLARGMTYKASLAGLHLGGGKAVILNGPNVKKSEQFFRSYGRFIHSLGGRYITAEDVNTCVQDIDYIACETKYVAGRPTELGGAGNPAPYTALGVFRGIEASCMKVYGSRSVAGKTVALQGTGQVGTFLAELLERGGAQLIFTEINDEHAQRFKEKFPRAQFVSPDKILGVQCDIFAPCALGAILDEKSIPQIKARIIAGAANNQLKEQQHGDLLTKRGILYAPDYLINAGGLISVSLEATGWSDELTRKKVEMIYTQSLNIFDLAQKREISTAKAADILAEERIRGMREARTVSLKRWWS